MSSNEEEEDVVGGDDRRIDGVQEIARIAGFAVRSVLATTRPSAARTLRRAFRRDVTSFGYWAFGIEMLDVAHRTARPPIEHLPGRVALVAGSPTDHPNGDHLARFLDRGGTTVFSEGQALSAIDSEIRLRSPKTREAIEVDGRAFNGILPAVFTPLFWVDEETHIPASTKDLEVLVSNGKRMPLVTRGKRGKGSFLHFATPVAPWRRDAPADAPRITPAAFAESVKINADGPLKERDATVPESLFRATFTMLLVVADLLASALADDEAVREC